MESISSQNGLTGWSAVFGDASGSRQMTWTPSAFTGVAKYTPSSGVRSGRGGVMQKSSLAYGACVPTPLAPLTMMPSGRRAVTRSGSCLDTG